VPSLGCREDAESPTAAEPEQALDITPAHTLSFRQVSAGLSHTCGVTTNDVAYCWGSNLFGELGDGTSESVARPVAVAGGLRFRQVSAGRDYTCGVTVDDAGYCWGINHGGQLGVGTNTGPETCSGFSCSTRPVAVASTRRFDRVSAGGFHTCSLTLASLAYCWGSNSDGQLGNGTSTGPETCSGAPCSTRPVAVAGGHRFERVTAGGLHTCSLTPTNLAYCWGLNNKGQLGDGTRRRHRTPGLVASGLRFHRVSAGFAHSCGLTPTDQAYCWGFNKFGQVGEGTTVLRLTPVRVHAGGRRFRQVNSGETLTCGVTTDTDRAYCWGKNFEGQLGDGTTINRFTPVPVAGGHLFRQVGEGSHHSCGVTTGARAFCWGQNSSGELGDGTGDNSLTPVAVAPPVP
jgi:alpha-tubulin suppressor-like RCC1 family protein